MTEYEVHDEQLTISDAHLAIVSEKLLMSEQPDPLWNALIRAGYDRHLQYMLEREQNFKRVVIPYPYVPDAPPSGWTKTKRRIAYRVEQVRLKTASFIAGYDVTEGGCWDD